MGTYDSVRWSCPLNPDLLSELEEERPKALHKGKDEAAGDSCRGTEAVQKHSADLQRGQGGRLGLCEAAPCSEVHVSDIASHFTSLQVTNSSACGEVECLASPHPQGTGGSVTSLCYFSELGMLLTVQAANLWLTQFLTGTEGECTCSMNASELLSLFLFYSCFKEKSHFHSWPKKYKIRINNHMLFSASIE